MPSVGLVGCGRWGRLVLRDLVTLGADVSVVTNRNARIAAESGAKQVVGSVRDLPAVDGVVVVTPTGTHADVLEQLLPRGVPLYCEKPVCDDAERARRLLSAGGGRLFVMDKWRYHGGVLELARIARTGELGRVVGLRTTRVGYGHSHADTDCIWTLLPHDLSIALEIFGRLPPPRSAVADRSDRMVLGLTVISAEEGGVWHVAEVGARSHVRQRVVTLVCADASATLQDAYGDHLVITETPPGDGVAAEPRPIRRPIPTDMPLLAELAAFIGHLEGGPPPKSSAAEAAESVATIAEIRRLAGI